MIKVDNENRKNYTDDLLEFNTYYVECNIKITYHHKISKFSLPVEFMKKVCSDVIPWPLNVNQRKKVQKGKEGNSHP